MGTIIFFKRLPIWAFQYISGRARLKGVCWFVSILVIFYWDIGRPDISLAYWQSAGSCIVYMRRYQPHQLLTPNTATIVTSNITHSIWKSFVAANCQLLSIQDHLQLSSEEEKIYYFERSKCKRCKYSQNLDVWLLPGVGQKLVYQLR